MPVYSSKSIHVGIWLDVYISHLMAFDRWYKFFVTVLLKKFNNLTVSYEIVIQIGTGFYPLCQFQMENFAEIQ